MTESFLDLRGISRHFGGIRAVNDVSFSVSQGDLVSLVGPNGAGKTTLFNLIAGQVKPSSGHVVFEGRRISSSAPDEVARCGILRSFQNTTILPGLTVAQHLALLARLRTMGRPIDLIRWRGRRRTEPCVDETVASILDLTGLTSERDKIAETLSYGLQKILGVGMALAADPRLLLADEPAADLNGTETARMEELLLAVHARGVSIILVEHDLKLVMRLSSRVIVLAQGELVLDGRPEQVRDDPRFIELYLGRVDDAA